MSEFLFRGRVPENIDDFSGERIYEEGEWVFGSLIWNNGFPFIVGDVVDNDSDYINFDWWVSVDPSTVGRYTGLPDKNEKKIFEGDVVSIANVVACVKWNKKTASFYAHDEENDIETITLGSANLVEIIGNIHDNPELLEAHDEAL